MENHQKLSVKFYARNRLSIKLILAVFLWLICALCFTSYTLFLSWELEKGGVAINEAGSLRMRTYRTLSISNQPHAPDDIKRESDKFLKIIQNLEKFSQKKIFIQRNLPITQGIEEIEREWKMMVNSTYKNTSSELINTKVVEPFVDKIDILVKLIEIENTNTIRSLRFFQSMLIFMALISAMGAVFLLFKQVIRPLDKLKLAIENLSKGAMGTRINDYSSDEFGVVSEGFNTMANHLQDLYQHLEDKVDEKTQALNQSNQELRILYEITAFLHESSDQETICRGFIQKIMQLLNADGGSIRLLDLERRKLDYIASIGLDSDYIGENQCKFLDGCYCGKLFKNSQISGEVTKESSLTMSLCEKKGIVRVAVFPLIQKDKERGLLTLYFKHNRVLTSQEEYLISMLMTQLAVAIENEYLRARNRQFAVAEERHLMAQELHDNIAQSLSFLNLQVQMLSSALAKQNKEQADKNLDFIKVGIQECYDDVRELLLNFRSKIKDEEFNDAVYSLLARFTQQIDIETEIKIEDDGPQLSSDRQLQVFFILQEALSNVRKHSQANKVEILIKNGSDFSMLISDNGIGFENLDLSKRMQHVGLSIMKERAELIGGKIMIKSELGKGTIVELHVPNRIQSLEGALDVK